MAKKKTKFLDQAIPIFGVLFVVSLTVALLSHSSAFNDAASHDFEEVVRATGSCKSPGILEEVLMYQKNSSTATMTTGFDLILEKDADEKLVADKRQLGTIKVDGKIDDWSKTDLMLSDQEYDPESIVWEEMSEAPVDSDDIKSYGYIMDKDFLYVYIEPKAMPGRGERYNYRINLNSANTNWMHYAIVFNNRGTSIEEYNPETEEFVRNITKNGSVFAKRNIFEAKISLKKLTKLPYSFNVSAIVYHDWKNIVDYAYDEGRLAQSINEKYKKVALEILCQYAVDMELIPDDPLPLAQAISDSFWYKLADKETKQEMISDGVTLIAMAEAAQDKYNFHGQKKFAEMDFETVLALANRAVMSGSYNYWQFYLDKNGRLNKEAYDFNLIQPETLEYAESIVASQGLLVEGDLDKSINQIEIYLTQMQKYRRYRFEDIEHLYNSYPDDSAWEQIYQESLAERANNDVNITSINNINVNKGDNFSASFQVKYLHDYGYYFGNCVDVAATAVAFYRSLGVPALPITYGAMSDAYYYEIHTFPVYYAGVDNRWYNYQHSKNPIWDFAKNEYIKDYNIFYFILLPQSHGFWSLRYEDFQFNKMLQNSRRGAAIVSEEEWNIMNEQGINHSEIIERYN